MRELAVEYVEPRSLKPAPYNPRRIDRKALRRLAELLDRHGFVAPVVARREDRLVIGGHQRLRANALRERPDAEVPVIFLQGVSDARAKALNVALNNLQAQGRFDFPKLGGLLEAVAAHEPDVPALTGFTESEIADLLDRLDESSAEGLQAELPEAFQVVVEVGSEAQQRQVYERMTREGYKCRLLIL